MYIVKHYQYETGRFVAVILLPVLIMAGLLVWGISLMLSGEQTAFAQVLVYGSLMLLFFSIIGIHTPSRIELDDEKIIVHAFFVTHTFYWDELTFAQLRVYKQTGKIYLRLGTKHLFKGRYWISTDIENFRELFETLQEKCFTEKKVPGIKR